MLLFATVFSATVFFATVFFATVAVAHAAPGYQVLLSACSTIPRSGWVGGNHLESFGR